MAYVKNWLHCVWGTKYRTQYLTPEILPRVIRHIKSNAKEKNIYIDIINGHREHLHCLISLDPDIALSKVIQLIKGESSYWINKNKITPFKFEWAVEYFAVSVSESILPKVRAYIKNQTRHHLRKTWEYEFDELISKYGFQKFSEMEVH